MADKDLTGRLRLNVIVFNVSAKMKIDDNTGICTVFKIQLEDLGQSDRASVLVESTVLMRLFK